MFTPSTWFFISKELADKWSTLEQALHINQTQNLIKGYKKGIEGWLETQQTNLPNYEKSVINLAKSAFKSINEDMTEAIRKALSLANEETLKMLGIEKTDNEKEILAQAITLARDHTNGGLNALVQTAVKSHSAMINTISTTANFDFRNKKIKKEFNMRKSIETSTLFDSIKRQTQLGIENGFKVVYKNGREMPFKPYMEMSIRTTVQNMALEMMEKASSNLGIVLFLCSEHADCADDHAEYQGKVYISQDWRSKIKDPEIASKLDDYVARNNIQTLEWAKGKPVYLTTRPNCRHFFTPITLDQALNLKETKESLRVTRGKYVKENYDDLIKQRYNERQIRKYRSRRDNALALLENAKSEDKVKLQLEIAHANQKMNEWRKRQRMLLASNPNLKREYRRENNARMAQDLGVMVERKLDLKEEKR